MESSDSIRDFFQDYTAALTSYSARRIADFHDFPCSIHTANGTRLLHNRDEMVAFCEQSMDAHLSNGETKVEHTVLMLEQVKEGVYFIKVAIRYIGAEGKPVSKELDYYVLQQDADGLKIKSVAPIKLNNKGLASAANATGSSVYNSYP